MSIHRSLRTKGALVRSRNVLNRYERIIQLRKSHKFGEDSSPYGLPKVRVMHVKKRGKAEKKAKEEGEKK
jgi:small basic protein (TIGR04137 family)